MWIDTDRSNLYFSDKILLVEGSTEVALFNRMIDDGRISLPNTSCSILHTEGKYNTLRFMRLLDGLGLPYAVIYDQDNTDAQTRLNELIETASNASENCLGTHVLAPDLETYLGWPQPEGGRNALKPGFAMLHYQERADTTPQLATLCSEVMSLLTN